ncbi:MAG: UDP-4-amino-4,6-dideoxy-N-acetyl-beta-L-altrosamine transaminase [Eubacterium sp.]|nr:UDP-4-amino-4,6-dideoxy-N-acetyl-beta-L-altrosamine transaminase [Eubacterium sp.]
MILPYSTQSIDEDDIQAVADVLRSDYLTTGPKIEQFEHTVAGYVGAKYAAAVANGTAALHAACYAAGIQPGDEVITSPLTFAASANCVLYCGGKPVFADVCPDTYNIDADDIRRKITDKTKAVIIVDLAGQPCDHDAVRRVADEYRLTLIEDAAHALGAVYKGKRVGSIADMTTFSFHPVKPVTTGEGGMVVTNHERFWEKIKLFRSHGMTRDTQTEGAWYYEQVGLGYNYRITDIQCALGCSQMKKLDIFLARRRELSQRYDKAFQDCPRIITPYQLPGTESGWHLYMIQVAGCDRKKVFDVLRANGIGVNVHYIPVYFHPYYRQNGYRDVCCPKAERIYRQLLSLPLYPGLTDGQQEEVIQAVWDAVFGNIQ